MSLGRRSNDRRRRVLFAAQQADVTGSTAASRRAAAALREARRPQEEFGSRVHRRLRGRWFSLVPVKRRTLFGVAGTLFAIALALSLAHYAAVAWPSLATQPEIARPLRLDRPDSFGRWCVTFLLAGSAGVSLLIYQLRRYRVDDYTGQYRLWRLVLVICVLASMNSLVSVIDWAGALLDVGFGKRVALSGNDWVRLAISFGGAVLALRLIAEVRSSRWSLATMMIAWSFLAIPLAANWNVFNVDSMGSWTLVTSAPLLGFTFLFLSLGGYLRMLYRQVRKLDENDSLSQRFSDWKLRVFTRDEQAEDEQYDEARKKPSRFKTQDDKPREKRRWWSRSEKRSRLADGQSTDEIEPQDPKELTNEEDNQVDTPSRPKRRWFGMRSPKDESEDQSAEPVSVTDDETKGDDSTEGETKSEKRGWFSLKRKSRKQPTDDNTTTIDKSTDEEKAASSEAPAKRRGLGSFLKRKTQEDPNQREGDSSQGNRGARSNKATGAGASGSAPSQPASSAPKDGDWIDPDSIDWDALNKSERRRLRKQIKRQGRAA